MPRRLNTGDHNGVSKAKEAQDDLDTAPYMPSFSTQAPFRSRTQIQDHTYAHESPPEEARLTDLSYVIITAARNEEAFIERIIEAMLAQTVAPLRWLIVSDGSTDRTDEIIKAYAADFPLIQYIRRETRGKRSFANKIHAFDLAYQHVRGLCFEFIGNLDADIIVPATYYMNLLDRFRSYPTLGLTSGFIDQNHGGMVIPRDFSTADSTPHGAQLVRRSCFEQFGGYLPLEFGGEDWCAEVNARRNGWTVRSFAEIRATQIRETNNGRDLLKDRLREGRMDYSMGSLLAFEVLKCARRLGQRPYILGALVRLGGFLASYLVRLPRLVPGDVIAFLRKEQWGRLRSLTFID